jgi:hypothetical protein
LLITRPPFPPNPDVIDALRQTLDLAKAGLIEYVRLDPPSNDMAVITPEGSALYDAALYNWDHVGTAGNPQLPITFPRGTQHASGLQHWRSIYRWLSTVAQHPKLFQDIPARYAQATS